MVTLFGFEIRRKSKYKPSPRSGYVFDEEDQIAATEAKRLKAERNRLMQEMALERQKFELDKLRHEQAQLYAEMAGDDDEEDDDDDGGPSPESMLMTLLMSKIQPTPATPQGVPVQQVSRVHYTDEEINQILESIPKPVLKLAKKMDDATLHKHILARAPNVDEDSVIRAVAMLRNR